VRLPKFEYLEPREVTEALSLLKVHAQDSKILAGGTDLLVRMKQRLAQPKFLISLKHLDSLAYIRQEDALLIIGARTALADICANNLIEENFPALARAVQSIGAPSIQHFSGTLGGNLCQENRCAHYNQSAFWRATKQPCHKAGGQICYAAEGSDRCRSTCQSDSAAALMALDARVTLQSQEDSRTIPLVDFYTAKGEQPHALTPEELLAEIQIPIPPADSGNAYQKLSYRSAIDYPILSVGVALNASNSLIKDAKIVIGAISSAPLLLSDASKHLKGKSISDKKAFETAAAMAYAHASVFAVDNVHSTLEYRISMIPVLVRRALEDAAAQI